MPRDSNNVYTLPEGAFQPNTVAQPGAVNNNFSDIATALTDSLTRAETTPFTRGLLDDADAATARTTLGATATGSALMTAADAPAARTAIGAANAAGQTFTGAVGTSTGDITAQAGSLRAQLSGAPTNGEVILGNGSARLFYNGTQFDLNANLSVPVVAGRTGGNAGTLRTWGTENSVNFRWNSSHLFYRVDETLERAIMFSPTGSAGLSEWRVMHDITPTGGTWAFFVLGFNSGGGPFSHVAGVAAGGTTVITGGASYAGFAWRIA